MRKSNWLLSKIILATTLAMFFSIISCQKQDTEADIAAINDLYNQSTLACSTGDVGLYLSSFTEDAVVMPPGFPAANGKEELRPIIEGLFDLFDLELLYTVDEIGVHGDRAFASSSFQYSMTPKEDEETTTIAGKELDIFKRQADGSWKIYIQCYNFDAQHKVE
ncbi:MAG: SgcJ/EcaC family oxidoreductase [Candidatus Neomarinimicrobiota bacterium]